MNRKTVRLFTAWMLIAVLLTAACAAFADSVTGYESDHFSFSFDGKEYTNEGDFGQDAILFAEAAGNPLSIGYFIVQESEFTVDTTDMPDEKVAVLLDAAVQGFIGDDDPEAANVETIEVDGKEARLFNYKLKNNEACALVLIRANRILIVSYFSGRATPEGARETIKTISETVKYLGE